MTKETTEETSEEKAHRMEIDDLLGEAQGNLIAFEFTLSLPGGRELDTNVGGKPMIFQVGAGEMLPALEEELAAMQPEETRTIILPPTKAYGLHTEQHFKEFPLEAIPSEARQIGRKVVSRGPDGTEREVDVVDIRGDKIVLDFNHELAGMTLHFDVKVLANDPVVM
jgi:FKBP-type peptidyl-prolyl cis-trans isomerase 2